MGRLVVAVRAATPGPRASAYLALGDTAKAVAHLTAFSELWKDADPELRPRVESALRLLSQLTRDR